MILQQVATVRPNHSTALFAIYLDAHAIGGKVCIMTTLAAAATTNRTSVANLGSKRRGTEEARFETSCCDDPSQDCRIQENTSFFSEEAKRQSSCRQPAFQTNRSYAAQALTCLQRTCHGIISVSGSMISFCVGHPHLFDRAYHVVPRFDVQRSSIMLRPL